MVKAKKPKIVKLPKSKRSVGGKKTKIRRSDAGGSSIPGMDAAFPGTGMPATPEGVPDLPMPNPALAGALDAALSSAAGGGLAGLPPRKGV